MRLTNYWWLLLWLFTGGLILDREFPKRAEKVDGKKVKRWNWLPAILLVLPYVIWAGFRGDQIGDTYAYRKAFLNMPDTLPEIPSYLNTVTKDKGFSAFSALLKCVIGNHDVIYFLLIAIFQMRLHMFTMKICDPRLGLLSELDRVHF